MAFYWYSENIFQVSLLLTKTTRGVLFCESKIDWSRVLMSVKIVSCYVSVIYDKHYSVTL